MATARQFSKIRNTGKAIQIEWNTKRKTASQAEEYQSHQLECPERPRPAFDLALQSFLASALTILGAPPTWSENTKVIGVSLNKEEDNRRGIVITLTRKCPHGAAPIPINTPHLRESMDEREKGPNFWLPGMEEQVAYITAEAEAYLDGDRAQGELFEGAAPAPTAAASESKKRKRGSASEPEAIGDVIPKVVGAIGPAAT